MNNVKFQQLKIGDRVKMQGYATLHVPFLRCSINDEFTTWFSGEILEIDPDFHIDGYVPRCRVKFDDERLGAVRIAYWDLLND